MGYTELIVKAELISSPDRGSGFRSFSPQILVNEADLEASGILAPGSRAEFRLLLSGSSEQVTAFAQFLKENLGDEERLFSLQDEQPLGGNALASALSYLKLTSLIALLLSALTIFLSLKRFSQSQHLRCALLLSLGMTQRSMVVLYLMQLVLAWAVLALMGSFTGIALEHMVSRWLDELLPQSLPAPALWRYFTGAGVGLALLVLLGLPPILGLSKVSVSALFRDEDIKTERRGLALQVMCALLLLVVLLSFLEAPMAAFILLAFLLLGGAVLGTIAQFCLKHLATPLAKRLLLGRLLVMRLRQQRQWHRLQSAVAILLLTLLSVVWVSRTDLLKDWQAQIPDDTPNYFVVNIQPWQTEGLQSFLDDANVNAVFFPMVRGRITTLNGAPIHAQMTPEQLEHNTLNRELNLSWSNQAPAHNIMTEGEWWQGETSGPLISVEEEMAQILAEAR
ncbi:ABC transporter permease [Nitrincola nitratireducens]|uniref:FtsX-like permease family protein n=1 Tax=Nitrincola nitratireducens TaxID=1229521 RepID=W9VIV2_9GAMM|nr:FtsX-like permease family protein [Nitrincola nitratireducens]EXJ10510.1 FtsX-like permease family protein [Nitrincola nitratireducens]